MDELKKRILHYLRKDGKLTGCDLNHRINGSESPNRKIECALNELILEGKIKVKPGKCFVLVNVKS